jgi:hypothetical protein
VLELSVDETTLVARIARRPSAAPEWTTTRLGSSLDVRRFLDDLKKRLKAWETEE